MCYRIVRASSRGARQCLFAFPPSVLAGTSASCLPTIRFNSSPRISQTSSHPTRLTKDRASLGLVANHAYRILAVLWHSRSISTQKARSGQQGQGRRSRCFAEGSTWERSCRQISGDQRVHSTYQRGVVINDAGHGWRHSSNECGRSGAGPGVPAAVYSWRFDAGSETAQGKTMCWRIIQ